MIIPGGLGAACRDVAIFSGKSLHFSGLSCEVRL